MSLFCLSQNKNDIIGQPIRIGKLEIAQYDCPNKMKWIEAVNLCNDLGKGWRLPTFAELNLLYKNKKTLEMNNSWYWSSTPEQDGYTTRDFQVGYSAYGTVNTINYVRAVRNY